GIRSSLTLTGLVLLFALRFHSSPLRSLLFFFSFPDRLITLGHQLDRSTAKRPSGQRCSDCQDRSKIPVNIGENLAARPPMPPHSSPQPSPALTPSHEFQRQRG